MYFPRRTPETFPIPDLFGIHDGSLNHIRGTFIELVSRIIKARDSEGGKILPISYPYKAENVATFHRHPYKGILKLQIL